MNILHVFTIFIKSDTNWFSLKKTLNTTLFVLYYINQFIINSQEKTQFSTSLNTFSAENNKYKQESLVRCKVLYLNYKTDVILNWLNTILNLIVKSLNHNIC